MYIGFVLPSHLMLAFVRSNILKVNYLGLLLIQLDVSIVFYLAACPGY